MEARDPNRRSRIAKALISQEFTARRAATVIGIFTVLVTIAAAVLASLIDKDDFSSFGAASWWAVQTVTTVGYGDVVPANTEGRLIGTVVMVVGIGFLTVITASIAAAFVENARRRIEGDPGPDQTAEKLDEILARLERLERELQGSTSARRDKRG